MAAGASCGVVEKEAKTLEEALAILSNPKATALDLGNAIIEDDDICRLAEALPNSTITSLILRRNEFGDRGAMAIAEVLPKTNIEFLDLAENHIGDEGAKALAAALPYTNIADLTLNVNEIGENGLCALIETLPATNLRTFAIGQNGLQEKPIRLLAETLPNTVLHNINIWNTPPGEWLSDLETSIKEGAVYTCTYQGDDSQAWGLSNSAKTNSRRCDQLAKELSGDIDSQFLEDNWSDLVRLLPAVEARTYHSAHNANVRAFRLPIIEQTLNAAHENGQDTTAMALRYFPFPKAKAWLAEHGTELTAADFLEKDGSLPTNTFLCQRGAQALFADPDLWESKAQAFTAYQSLPEEAQQHITTIHQLTAQLSRVETAQTRER